MARRLVAGGACLAFALVLAGAGPAGDSRRAPASSITREQVLAFDEFPLYSAGERVDGLPLTATLRRDDTATYVSFVYGDCTPDDETGCAPPAEIQVWPACRRNLALYEEVHPAAPALERATVRGAPAVFLDDGTRLEIQTGSSIVVVFADSRGRALRIASALRAVNGSVVAGGPLPQPAPGALEGTLDC
jgi:hypothetical protein